MSERQEYIDRFYVENGPCCAGCDWWGHLNSLVGECRASAPVSGENNAALLGISGCTIPLSSGHVLTPKNHHCGEFKDSFDWTSLPLSYLRRIGMNCTTTPPPGDLP